MSIYRGKVWKLGDDVNTDLIYPNIVVSLPEEERPKYCMRAIRPEFADEVKPGDIVVAGKNFGTGSGRPVGQILKVLGIRCLIAESINGLCFRTSINSGFPVLSCKGVSRAFMEGDGAEVNLTTGEIKNLRTGEVLRAKPLPEFMLELIEAGGMIPLLKKEGLLT